MSEAKKKLTTIQSGSSFLKLAELKPPFFRIIECSKNLPHKPGTIVVGTVDPATGEKNFFPFSSDKVTGMEYIPEGSHNWGELSLDQIGIINGTDKSSTKHNYLQAIEEHLSKKLGQAFLKGVLQLLEGNCVL